VQVEPLLPQVSVVADWHFPEASQHPMGHDEGLHVDTGLQAETATPTTIVRTASCMEFIR
jgi:hypothetical protein